CAWASYGLAGRFIGIGSWSRTALCMVISVMIAVVVYVVSVIAMRAITMEDLELIPGGKKLGKLLHIR
ncbi:MAG: polysaccharide biosynthesis protein, partial [Oscillospiraceae bacterium]|nr:polysaccharide biosynthesis protein [Oscillospiraceae bacterium]